MSNANEKEWYRNIRNKYNNLNPIAFKFNMDDKRQADIYDFLIKCDAKRTGGHRKKKVVMAAVEKVIEALGTNPSVDDIDAFIAGEISIGTKSPTAAKQTVRDCSQDTEAIDMYCKMLDVAVRFNRSMNITVYEFLKMDEAKQRTYYMSAVRYGQEGSPATDSSNNVSPVAEDSSLVPDDDGIIDIDL